MHAFLTILPVFALAAIQADDRKADPSIVPSKAPKISSKVENGAVYDRASISVKDLDMVVIPDNARLVREGNGKEIQIFMVKTLSFAGHPPKPITLRHVRQNMGVCSRTDGKTILLATFGEWDSKREGAAGMELLIIAPKGINVAKRSKHSGVNSVANVPGDAPPKRPNEGYWYGPASPAEGWTAVPHEPDPSRRISQK